MYIEHRIEADCKEYQELSKINFSDTVLFLEALDKASSELELRTLLAVFLEQMGIEKYAYLGSNPPHLDQRTYVFNNYPQEWTKHYADRDYVFSDPLLVKARQSRLPFTWDRKRLPSSLSKKQKRILREAGKYGFDFWYTAPVHGMGGEFACLTAGFGSDVGVYREFLSKHANQFFVATLYFHNALWQMLDNTKQIPDIFLTPRQVEVLSWAAAGKTAWEISQILELSESGVRDHILKAAERMNTHNLTSTVAAAITYGFIRI